MLGLAEVCRECLFRVWRRDEGRKGGAWEERDEEVVI